ncbi:MAG TPA: hypothetical protein PKV48_03655 [Thermodesulfobacteriota bacterium]|nr:hypothetical protein [Thermodesulfobacteriota bacterium]
MIDFFERVAWIINRIREDDDLTWPVLAKKLGTDRNTIAKYANKNSNSIKGIVLEKLVSSGKCSSDWLLSGKGEPFQGAREKYPEVCGPRELAATITGDQTANYPTAGVDQFAQAVSQLKIIFDSKDPTFKQIITTGLNSFAQAITERRENYRLRNLINTMEQKIGRLEKDIAELRAGVSREGGDVQGDTSAEETAQSTEKKAG